MTRLGLWAAVSLCVLLVAVDRSATAQEPSSDSSIDELLDAAIDESDSEYDTPSPPTFSEMFGTPPPFPSNPAAPSVAKPVSSPNTKLAMIFLGVGGAIYLFLELVAEVRV